MIKKKKIIKSLNIIEEIINKLEYNNRLKFDKIKKKNLVDRLNYLSIIIKKHYNEKGIIYSNIVSLYKDAKIYGFYSEIKKLMEILGFKIFKKKIVDDKIAYIYI